MGIDYSVFEGYGFPKKPKWARKVERAEKHHATAVAERKHKRESKKLTAGGCRWPHTTAEEKRACRAAGVESAHIRSKGMGGDHGRRSKPEDLVTVCKPVHQGPGSIHAGKKRIVPLTPEKGLGPCAFEEKIGGRWVRVGEEIAVGVLKR